MSVKTKNMPEYPEKPKNAPNQQRSMVILVVIVAVALLAAAVFIVINRNASVSSGLDYSQLPSSRTSDGGFVLGNPDAPVTIVEFADFMCPHCQDYKATVNQMISELVFTGQAKFEYRMMNTQGERSQFSAQLAECAEEIQPGDFWKAYEILYNMTSTGRFSMSSGRDFADQMGMNYTELLNCTGDARQITVDGNLGNRLGVTGTPTILIRYGDAQPTLLGTQSPSFEAIREIVRQANSTASN